MNLSFKIAHTLFVIFWFWLWTLENSWANFLWFSDIAMILTIPAIWLGSALIASTMCVGILFFETCWLVDFLVQLVAGREIIGLASYMFSDKDSLLVRIISGIFHIEMPLLYVCMLFKLGYRSSAFKIQTAISWVVLPLSFYFSTQEANINWVHALGPFDISALSPMVYLLSLMVVYPICIYLPSHLLFKKFFRASES